MRAFVVLLAAAVIACSPTSANQATRVASGGHVRDVAGIMSAGAENRVDAKLAKLEATTKDQVAVVTVVNLPASRSSDFRSTMRGAGDSGRRISTMASSC